MASTFRRGKLPRVRAGWQPAPRGYSLLEVIVAMSIFLRAREHGRREPVVSETGRRQPWRPGSTAACRRLLRRGKLPRVRAGWQPARRGYSLLEVIVAMSVFLTFLAMVATIASEIRRMDKKYPVNFMAHPQVSAVVSRIRRDVLDATSPYYPGSYQTYTQGPKTLILYSLQANGFAETVVYDFSKVGEVRRLSYNVGVVSSDWVARGTPRFTVTDFPVPGHPTSVRVKAFDENGRVAIDQIFQPRPHEE